MYPVTEYWDIRQDYKGGIERAAHFLESGEPVVFPTETVYGIGSLLKDESAAAKIFELKGRQHSKPLTAYLMHPSEAVSVARDIPDLFYKIAEAFLPGPLALILPRNCNVPDTITGGRDTIAIRIPDNIFVLDLLGRIGAPIAGTSANISDQSSAKTAEEAFSVFRGRVPMVVDGGESRYGIESTVVDLSGRTPRILRNGMITVEELEYISETEFEVADRNPAPVEFYLPQTPLKIIGNIGELAELHSRYSKILLLSRYYYPKSLTQAESVKLSAKDIFEHLQMADINEFDCIAVLFDSKNVSEVLLRTRIDVIAQIQKNEIDGQEK